MAVIGRIRKQSTLLLIIIGVALAAFILGDFVRKSNRGESIFAEVDGEKISWFDFEKRYKDIEDNYKQRSGKENFSSAEVFQLKEMTWNQMLQEYLLSKEYEKLGISVPEEEMNDMLTGANPHPYIVQAFRDPETGNFNHAMVQNFIQNKEQAKPEERKFFDNIVKSIKDERISSKYISLVSKSYYMPKNIAKKIYDESYSNATLKVVQVKYSTIDDKSITLTDDDYKKWYDENKYRFEQVEEVRDIDYVIFNIDPTPEDLNQIDEDVKKLYIEFQEAVDAGSFVSTLPDSKYDSSYFKKGTLPAFIDTLVYNSAVGTFFAPAIVNNIYTFGKLLDIKVRPDSVKASHILIQYEGARGSKTKRTKEEAKKLTDSIFMEIKKNPNSFLNFVFNMSEYPSAKKDTGNLSWIIDGDINVQLFYDSLYTMKTGEFRTVETALGYHIMLLTGITQPQKKVRVAIGNKAIEPSENTIQNIHGKANKFASENENTIKFNDAIVKEGLTKRTADNLKAMEYTVPGITDGREIVRWAWDKKIEKNAVSPVFDVDGKYVVATLKEIKPKGFATLEQVKPFAEAIVKREKKAKMLIDKVNAELSKTKDPLTVAQNLNTTLDTVSNFNFGAYNLYNYGPELSVIGQISNMKPKETSKPLKGEMGVYIVYYEQNIPVSPINDYKMFISQFSGIFSQKVSNELIKALENNTKITDNRYLFY